jgi:hypothetical protein
LLFFLLSEVKRNGSSIRVVLFHNPKVDYL